MPGDAMEDVIFQYDGSFPGFLCCVFDSYAHKEFPIAFYSDEECVSLYPVRVVVTRRDHSQRVYDSLQRLSPPALKVLRRAWLTCLEDKELRLYAFIRKLYDQGPGFMRSKADDVYYPIACALRHLGGELEKLRGFVRFSDYNGILGGEIEPRNRVLPLLANHFCSRMAGESFFLYDRTHRELLLYTKGQRRIVPVESLTLELPGSEELQYRALWQEFFPHRIHPGADQPPLSELVSPQAVSGRHDGISSGGLRGPQPSSSRRRSASPRRSSRDICTWDTPRIRAVCSWVRPLKKRSRMVIFSRSGSWSMASRRAMCSTMRSSGLSVPRVDSRVSPSAVSCCRDSGAPVASSTLAISSGVSPVSSASSDSLGSRPSRCRSRSRAAARACPFSRMLRPTFIAPLSRKKRRISPAIFGTA